MKYPRPAPLLLLTVIILAGTLLLWFRFNVPPGTIGSIYPYDLIYYFCPMMEYASERLGQGDVPLWNPYSCGGVPFLATLQVGVFYPGNFLSLLMPIGRALSILMFCEVFLSGIFAALFFRALGPSVFSASLGGVLFMFACVLGQSFWPDQVSTILWMPFLFLCVEKLVSGGGRRWWAAFAVGTALQVLAGFPQYLLYTFYVLVPYAVLRLVIHSRMGQQPWRELRIRVLQLGIGCGLGVGLAAIQLLPTLELMNHSVRAGALDEGDVEYLQTTGWRPPQLEDIAGNAFESRPRGIAFDIRNDAGYLGMVALFPIVLAIIAGWRNPLTWFFLVVAILSLLLSFGYEGGSRWLYELYAKLPTGSLFRTPSRFRLLTFFSLIILAVFGIDRFQSGFPELRKDQFLLGLAVGGSIGLLVAALILSTGIGIVLAFVTLGLLAGAYRFADKPRCLLFLKTLYALVLLGDIAYATGPSGSLRDIPVKWAQSMQFRRATLIDAETFGTLKRRAGLDRIYTASLRPLKPLRPLERTYSITDYEALVPGRWGEISRAMKASNLRIMYGLKMDKAKPFLDQASVKFFVWAQSASTEDLNSSKRKARDRKRYRLNTIEPKISSPDTRAVVKLNAGAMPRAYLVGNYEIVDPQEALDRVMTGEFDYRSTVLLEQDPGMTPSPQSGKYQHATMLSYHPERVVIETRTRQERILVLTDTFYPGWKVYVDDVEQEILQANYLFRAVRVPGGTHQVVFEYRPASFSGGVALSCTSLMAFVLLFAAEGYVSCRRRKKHADNRNEEHRR